MKKKLLSVAIAITLMFGSVISINAGPGDEEPSRNRPIRPIQIPITICDIPPYDTPPCDDDAG